jgi:catechol 2,3-dioxygenase-like lactoylglutathione lyase family enzyme
MPSEEGSKVPTGAIKQCAMVVHDLDEGVRAWTRLLGIAPWTAYRLEPPRLKEMRYHDEDVEFSLRHALAWQGDLQFELVQPLSGPSIFADHLAAHGEGLHHVGSYVPDHPAAVAEALAAGFVPLQSARGFGAEGDGAFAYFKHPDTALIVELISAPRVRITPEFVYPPSDA